METMFIHVNDPSLNRNLGKYQMPNVWNNILQDTPALQLKQSSLTTLPYIPLTRTIPPQAPQAPYLLTTN